MGKVLTHFDLCLAYLTMMGVSVGPTRQLLPESWRSMSPQQKPSLSLQCLWWRWRWTEPGPKDEEEWQLSHSLQSQYRLKLSNMPAGSQSECIDVISDVHKRFRESKDSGIQLRSIAPGHSVQCTVYSSRGSFCAALRTKHTSSGSRWKEWEGQLEKIKDEVPYVSREDVCFKLKGSDGRMFRSYQVPRKKQTPAFYSLVYIIIIIIIYSERIDWAQGSFAAMPWLGLHSTEEQ